MEDEKIEYFGSHAVMFLDWLDGEDLNDQRKRHGYTRVDSCLLGPFFYTQSTPYIEIKQFYNKDKDVYINELWDWNYALFTFATGGELNTFCLIERFVSLAKNMVDIEKNLFYLDKNSDD